MEFFLERLMGPLKALLLFLIVVRILPGEKIK